jgi:hypothetical protein
MIMGAPEGATLDESGQWWWDGSEWQPVNDDLQQPNDGWQQPNDWSEDDVLLEIYGDEFDHEFDPTIATGQVLFDPQPCKWTATSSNVKCDYRIKNGNSSPIANVQINWTVKESGQADKDGVKTAAASLAAGALSSGSITWPFTGTGSFLIQIKFDGGQDGDHDQFKLN